MANFRESPKGEVCRILILRTRVNRPQEGGRRMWGGVSEGPRLLATPTLSQTLLGPLERERSSSGSAREGRASLLLAPPRRRVVVRIVVCELDLSSPIVVYGAD